jgi:hypothetical protein
MAPRPRSISSHSHCHPSPSPIAPGPTGTLHDATRSAGIAYAWDPELCDKLLPAFREDIIFLNLVTCHDLKAALLRAFAAWASNHEYISFVDVSHECETMESGLTSNCEMVELWITYRKVWIMW